MLRRLQKAGLLPFSRCRLHCGAHQVGYPEEEEKKEEPGLAGCNAIVSLCEKGQLEAALELTQQNHYLLHPVAYQSLLQICSQRTALHHARFVNAHMAMHGTPSPIANFDEHIVLVYSKCGDVESALSSFRSQPERTSFSWNALISGYADIGDGVLALQVYTRMLEESEFPNEYTFNTVLKACGNTPNLQVGKAIHACAWKIGLHSQTLFANSLVSMYSKCDAIFDAEIAFQAILRPDVISYTLILSVLIERGLIQKAMLTYTHMKKQNVSSNEWTISTCLRGCIMLADDMSTSLKERNACELLPLEMGRELHNEAALRGLEGQGFVGSSLLRMYGKCGCVCEMEHVFFSLSSHDVVSWTAMLLSYVSVDDAAKAIKVYRQMVASHIIPDTAAICAALQACSSLIAPKGSISNSCAYQALALETGQALYAEIRRKHFVLDASLGNTLVHFFVKCEQYAEAETIFANLCVRDVVSWTTMLPAYTEQGQAKKALQLYRQMQKEGASPDEQTFVNVLRACFKYADKELVESEVPNSSTYVALEISRELHRDALERGYDNNMCISTELVAIYGKCRCISEAEYCFKTIRQPDTIALAAMLSAYVIVGQSRKALQLYSRTFTHGVKADDAITGCALQSCSTCGSLMVCLEVHHSILWRTDCNASPILATRLIFAYASCGSALDSQAVLNVLSAEDVVAWNALMSGCIQNGDYTGAFEKFDEMKGEVNPNCATFLMLLSACCQAGLVQKGVKYFESMEGLYKLAPQIHHYGCVFDLLGRAGDFDKIEELLSTMQMQPEPAMWLGLLGACQVHGKVELGKYAYEHVIQVQPRQGSAYVLMSSLFMNAGMQEQANEVNLSREKACAWKKPGESLISINGELYSFIVKGDNSLFQEAMMDVLQQKNLLWRQKGYVPQIDYQLSYNYKP